MIDMRRIYFDDSFNTALNKFNGKLSKNCKEVDNCKWSEFKNSFLKFSKYKCPICEDTVNSHADIDHYRPKAKHLYPFLECCYQNYMIMCTDCNRRYKRMDFPLYNNEPRATCIEEIKNEKPLLVNPTHDDIYELFEILFLRTSSSKNVLILKPKDELTGHLLEKANMTIKTYGIGNCDENDKIDGCRIEVLENHYEKFLDLANLAKNYFKNDTLINKRKLAVYLKDKPKLKSYGLYNFIIKDQFEIAI